MRAVLLFGLALFLHGCTDSFSPPPLPDLKKDPYDFSVVVPPYKGADMASTDLAGEFHDLSSSD